jgi:hypothetical protein
VTAPTIDRLRARDGNPRWQALVAALIFAFTLTIRIHGISRHFWMLGDQIRDWSIALGSFKDLPLIGPPTHIGGYTLGPVFYWILWMIRVVVGPWFENLPHGGGIGQAILQSAADALLLVAIWRRTKSMWVALATAILVASASYDLCLSALVWNPTLGTALAKTAMALVLVDWPQRSAAGAAVTTAAAWCAVQSYTGTIFVALGVALALVAVPLVHGDRRLLIRNTVTVAAVVALLQLPLLFYQISTHFQRGAMSGVTGSVAKVLSGQSPIALAHSWAGYIAAFDFIQVQPFAASWMVWVLVATSVIVAVKYRRDPALLAVTLVPQLAAVAGYAFYVGDFLDRYYYFSLMAPAVLTIALGLTAIGPRTASNAIGIALVVVAVLVLPQRLKFASTMHRMPEYGPLLDGSRTIARRGEPMRAITTEFPLPPSCDRYFLYSILGGRLDRASAWVATIRRDGSVAYENVAGRQ